jgi:hypothetical protein
VYSPKIAEKLIPILYHAAKAQGVPMTILVNRLLTEALAKENLPQTARDAFASDAVPAPEVLPAQVEHQLAA